MTFRRIPSLIGGTGAGAGCWVRSNLKCFAAGISLLAVLPMVSAGPEAQDQPPSLKIEQDVNLVTLTATVVDRRGRHVTGLRKSDFRIYEDGVPQKVAVMESQELPISIGVVFDTSGSMIDDIQMARTAAIRFLNTLRDAREITLVDFDTEVRVARYGQQDFPRLVERIRGRKPDGFTAMYDALGLYLDGTGRNEGRTILVIFTDGGDTRSTLRFSDAMTLIRAANVTIYAVGFLEHQRGGDRSQQRLQLSQMAAESGGEAFFPLSTKQIDEAYDKILAQIRAQYSLGFISSNAALDGTWRRVDIKVRRSDLKDLRVQTRKGYFAPYRP